MTDVMTETDLIELAERGAAELEGADADELLPVTYTDNYVTVYGGETVEIRAEPLSDAPRADWVRVTGYNTAPVTAAVR